MPKQLLGESHSDQHKCQTLKCCTKIIYTKISIIQKLYLSKMSWKEATTVFESHVLNDESNLKWNCCGWWRHWAKNQEIMSSGLRYKNCWVTSASLSAPAQFTFKSCLSGYREERTQEHYGALSWSKIKVGLKTNNGCTEHGRRIITSSNCQEFSFDIF